MGIVTAGQKKEMDKFDIRVLNHFIRVIHEEIDVMGMVSPEEKTLLRQFFISSIVGEDSNVPRSLPVLKGKMSNALDEAEENTLLQPPRQQKKSLALLSVFREVVATGLKETEDYQNKLFPGGRAIAANTDRGLDTAEKRERERFNLVIINTFTRAIHDHCDELHESKLMPTETINALRLFFAKSLLGEDFQLPSTMEGMRKNIMNAIEAAEDKTVHMSGEDHAAATANLPLIRNMAESSIQKADEYQNHNHPLMKKS